MYVECVIYIRRNFSVLELVVWSLLYVMEVSGPQSISLDIELDSDVQRTAPLLSKDEGKKSSFSLFSFYDPPPCASDLAPTVPEGICIYDLPKRGLREVELCLNLPSRGTMFNWEFVAAEFGFSNRKIMHLRTSTNPTAALLQENASRPLDELLHVLAKINRVDALLSVQPYLKSVLTYANAETQSTDSGAFVNVENNTALLGASVKSDKQKFILVTHHEFDVNVALKKNYKWFLKNLRNQAKQSETSIFDIDDYLETSCQFEGLHMLFADAASIVCVFTNDYLEMLSAAGNEQSLAVKQYLHKLMNAEFVERGDNQRFRAVILQGTSRNVLPLGWAKSTLVYEFPAHHLQLFQKLFS